MVQTGNQYINWTKPDSKKINIAYFIILWTLDYILIQETYSMTSKRKFGKGRNKNIRRWYIGEMEDNEAKYSLFMLLIFCKSVPYVLHVSK